MAADKSDKNQDKNKALELALAQIDKQYGKGSVMRLGEGTRAPVEVIPTGSISLDVALGTGGLPRGRVVEIFGPESSGKTSVALHAVAGAQQQGGTAAFIDAEHALDPDYAKAIGVDTDSLLVAQPDTGEQALEIADMLIRSGALDAIVIDSVAALVPRAEIEGEMGDSHVGLQARLMSQALRKLTSALYSSQTTAIFINQLREKVGVMFGSPETTTGGKALKFYSSVRLDVRRIETLKDGSEAVGNRTRVKVVKNKCVAEGTRVHDPVTGVTHHVEDIVDNQLPVHVVAANKKGELSAQPVVAWFDQGEQDTLGLRLRDGGELRVTPDHQVLTDRGWRLAQDLEPGDRVARPRRFGQCGSSAPVPAEHARMLGYLIGDGYVGGKTPIQFFNAEESLRADATRIAESLGCRAHCREGSLSVTFSHAPGVQNRLLELCREHEIRGTTAQDKAIPSAFFDEDIDSDVLGNLVFGIFESDGHVSQEETGGLRLGFTTVSEQLAHQLHWLLLRWEIGSVVRKRAAGRAGGTIDGRTVLGKNDIWEIRVSGIDNVQRFAEFVPMWGPRGTALTQALAEFSGRYRASQRNYVPDEVIKPVLWRLRDLEVNPRRAAELIGDKAGDPKLGMRAVLGSPRMRRDRLEVLAAALEDPFLLDVLSDQLWYSKVAEVLPLEPRRTFDIEVDELHNFVADDVVVHNCAPPFKQAEFDIIYGIGISREGSLIDMGVEHGIIRKSGAWYTYEGDQLGQGKENARKNLRENPDTANEIEKKIKEKIGLGADAGASGEATEGGGDDEAAPVDF
ncbi:intein-containing recombinase RecA [Bounagaea algeriensis]